MVHGSTVAFAVCHTCRLRHRVAPGSNEGIEFFSRHRGHRVELATPNPLLARLRDTLGVRQLLRRLAVVGLTGLLTVTAGEYQAAFDERLLGYGENANVKLAFGTATTFTKTNANLANSATAGWKGNSIDNSSNLMLDAYVSIELAAVNTAPANAKGVHLYVYSLIEGTAYASTGDGTIDGSEGTVTFPDYTTLPVCLPLLGFVPYPVQNKAINSIAFSVSRVLFGAPLSGMPYKWGIAMVNHSGMTLSVTNIYYIEVYSTVA